MTGKRIVFRRTARLTMCFNCFGPFLTSRRPGRYLGSIPVPVRFIYTEYEPVASHEHPNCYDFHAFHLIFEGFGHDPWPGKSLFGQENPFFAGDG